MSCTFNEDEYRSQQLNKYLEEQELSNEEQEAKYQEMEDAMIEKAEAQRELDREEDNE